MKENERREELRSFPPSKPAVNREEENMGRRPKWQAYLVSVFGKKELMCF
jgi:hypothetical protein